MFIKMPIFFAVDTYFKWGDNKTIGGILQLVLTFLFGFVGIAVIGGIVYGAILYTSSAGNAAQAKKGIDVVRNAVIALILYALFWAIMNYFVL
jgi:hypothetical protein